ncbi:lysoplasmalogenase family protein [Pseudovibrio sp. SPO723]|uniref:lysoplasmalogenase family protein n=1 Tax=Nesiotobacter zosterae TaxID=392721 RepID=UPI0029C4BC92|nr:lysoplasmalogenase family protein [Pseudovibrio sp. SPO723]MDX5594182.1 lysoplasmalogenase family protein [Pseudovibrio sp. SPO723]
MITALGPAIIGASLLSATIYGAAFSWRDASALKTLLKTLSLAVVCVLAAANDAPWLLVAALAASSLGDAALAAPGDKRFLVGLCSFALAHVLYIILFWQMIAQFDMTVLAIAGGVFGLLALSTMWWLLPFTHDLKLPVAVYVLLITGMGVLATQLGGLVMAGALAFIASDLLLSLQLFRLPERPSLTVPISVALWVLYYGGQISIFLALTAA